MNLRGLEYLVAMVGQQSFRSAAVVCGVSQPTLSAQLRKLREELGVVLIDRAASRPVLTPIGQQVVGRARAILAGVEAIRVITRDETGATAQLRLGVFPTLGPYLLPHVLPYARKRFPNLQLLLIEEKTQQLVTVLRSGGLDIAPIAIPADDPHLGVRPLFREEPILATPAGYPLIDGTGGSLRESPPIPPARVAKHELLVLGEGHCLGDQMQRWASEHRIRLRKDYRVVSLETMRHMIASDNGLSLLPAMTVLPPVPSTPDLALRRTAPPAPSRDVALVWSHTSPRTATLEALAPALIPSIALVQEL